MEPRVPFRAPPGAPPLKYFTQPGVFYCLNNTPLFSGVLLCLLAQCALHKFAGEEFELVAFFE